MDIQLKKVVRKRDRATRYFANGCRVSASAYDDIVHAALCGPDGHLDCFITRGTRTHWRHYASASGARVLAPPG